MIQLSIAYRNIMVTDATKMKKQELYKTSYYTRRVLAECKILDLCSFYPILPLKLSLSF